MRHIQLDDDEKKAAKHDLLDQGAAAMLARITQLEKLLVRVEAEREQAYSDAVEKMDRLDEWRYEGYLRLTQDIARLHMVHYGMEHSALHTLVYGLEHRIADAGDTYAEGLSGDDCRMFYDLCKALAYVPQPGTSFNIYEEGRMREHEIKMLDDIYR